MTALVLVHQSRAEVCAVFLSRIFHTLTQIQAPLPLRATSGTTSHSRTPSVQEARETSRPISRQTSKESHQPQVRQTGQHQLAKSAVQEPSEDSGSEVDIPISNLS